MPRRRAPGGTCSDDVRSDSSSSSREIAATALEDICDAVNRVLNETASETDDTDFVITTREFPVELHDFSLLNMDGQADTSTQQTDATTARSPVGTSRNLTANVVENNTIQQYTEPEVTPRTNYNLPITENFLMQLLREIRELRVSLTGNAPRLEAPPREPMRESVSFHNHALNLSYGRSTHDVRNQRRSTVSFLTLKDVRNMIPDIDRTSRDRVKEFLNANFLQ